MIRRADPKTERSEKIGALCVDIAGIVFPHFSDSDRREKLAVALIGMSRLLIEQAAAVAAADLHDARRWGASS